MNSSWELITPTLRAERPEPREKPSCRARFRYNVTMQFPRGYVGTNHETIGSDVIAVLATLRSPEEVLGTALYARLKDMKPDAWYPVSTLLDLLEHLA